MLRLARPGLAGAGPAWSGPGMDPTIRDVAPADHAWLLAANAAEVPAVGDLDVDRLEALVAMAESALVVARGEDPLGFVIALPPGVAYGSPNYRWLSSRYDRFVYVDRIVVTPAAQGLGLGRRLYDAVVERTSAPRLVAEVNTRPRNDASLAFHARYGFVEVGTAEPYGDGVEVVYLAKPLDRPPAERSTRTRSEV